MPSQDDLTVPRWYPAIIREGECTRCGKKIRSIHTNNSHGDQYGVRGWAMTRGAHASHARACGRPDPRLTRWTGGVGYTVAYRTRDGHFDIENGLAGMTGGHRTGWSIVPRTAQANAWLACADHGTFRTKREATAWLRESVYDYAHRDVVLHGDGSVTVDGVHYPVERVMA